MEEIVYSPYFGIALSILAFGIGMKLHQKWKTPFCNPLIVGIALVAAILLLFTCSWHRQRPVWQLRYIASLPF